jgi:hypothetical protein
VKQTEICYIFSPLLLLAGVTTHVQPASINSVGSRNIPLTAFVDKLQIHLQFDVVCTTQQ